MQRNKVLIIVAVVAAVLLTCCCVATGAVLIFRASGTSTDGAYRLSDEQQSVLSDLGDPDTFTLVFGEAVGDDFDEKGELPRHRVEYWDYHEPRVRVVFRDGRFVRHETLEPLGDGEWVYPALKPGQFTHGMTAQEVSDLVGEIPDAAVEGKEGTAVDLTVTSFRKQVYATFERDALVHVSTVPLKKGGE